MLLAGAHVRARLWHNADELQGHFFTSVSEPKRIARFLVQNQTGFGRLFQSHRNFA